MSTAMVLPVSPPAMFTVEAIDPSPSPTKAVPAMSLAVFIKSACKVAVAAASPVTAKSELLGVSLDGFPET